MKRILVLCLTLMATMNAYASITRFAAPGSTVNITISRNEPNRIAIAGDRITSFIKTEGTFNQSNDPNSGDIFITPVLIEGPTKKSSQQRFISGFITTESGATLQLFLQLSDIPSTNTEITIKQIGSTPAAAEEWERSFSDYRVAATAFAKAIGHGLTVPGMDAKYYEKGIRIESPALAGFDAKVTAFYTGFNFIGEAITVTNNGQASHALNERKFNDRNVVGVWMIGAANRVTHDDDVLLAPGESMRVVRIRKNQVIMSGGRNE